jgi:hypothetical protein
MHASSEPTLQSHGRGMGVRWVDWCKRLLMAGVLATTIMVGAGGCGLEIGRDCSATYFSLDDWAEYDDLSELGVFALRVDGFAD